MEVVYGMTYCLTVVWFAAVRNIWIAYVACPALAPVAIIPDKVVFTNAISANASIGCLVSDGACAGCLISNFPIGRRFIKSNIDCIPQEAQVMVQFGIGSAVANEFECGKRYIRYTLVITKQDVATSSAVVGDTAVFGSIASSYVCELTVSVVRAERCAAGPGRDRRCIHRRVYPVYMEITA
jgi:hypothetical protein